MNKQLKMLILILVLVMALCLFSACNNEEENQVDDSTLYTITVENGYINGNPELQKVDVEKGVEVEVSAIIPDGMKFKEWVITETETEFSKSNPCIFKALSDRSITAIFEEADPIENFTITIENGFLNGDQSLTTQEFAEGTKVVLYANVPEGKVFNGFYSDNALVSKINPYENYCVKKDATIVATFRNEEEAPEEEDQCELKVVGGVIGTSDKTEDIIAKGTMVSVVATVLDTQVFDGWYENDKKVSSSQTYTFSITYSRRLVAKCTEKPSYMVTIHDGTLDDADGKVLQGKKVKCTAYKETDDLVFDRWEVTINDVVTIYKESQIELTVNSNIDVVAIYNDKYKVSAYQQGEENPFYEKYIQAGFGSVSIEAPKKDGYSFDSWIDAEDNIVFEYNKIVVQGIEKDIYIYAKYKQIEEGQTNILVHNGQAYEDAAYTKLLGDDFSVNKGKVIYIKPDVSDGVVNYQYSLDSIGGTLSASNNYQLSTIASYYDIDCTKTIPITVSKCKSTLGINSVQLGQTYTFVEDIDTLTNMFSDWQINGRPNLGEDIVVNGKHYLVLTIDQDVLDGSSSLQINMLYSAIVKVDVVNGTINDKVSANVPADSEITIIADDIENKLFKEWRCDGQVISTEAIYKFTIYNSGKYEAYYYDISTISYSDGISIYAENNENLLISDAENKVLTFIKGSKVIIKSAQSGFNGWTLLTNTIKSNIAVTDAVLEEGYYSYSFNVEEQYAIRFSSTNRYYVKTYNDSNKGNSTINVLGTNYEVLDSVTITAKDDLDDVAFICWKIGDKEIEENPYTFLIDDENIDAYAIYKKTYTVTIKNADANDSIETYKTVVGEMVSIEITNEDPHHKFKYWIDSDGNNILESNYEFELTKNITYTAVFDEMVKITLINGTLTKGEYQGLSEGYYLVDSSINAIGTLIEHSNSDGWYQGDSFISTSIETLLPGQKKDTIFTFKYIKHAKSIIQIYLNGVYSGNENDKVTYYSEFINQKVSVDDIDGYRFNYIEDHLGQTVSSKSYQIAQLNAGQEIVAKAYFIKTHKITIINGDGYGIPSSNSEAIVDTGSSYSVTMSNTNDYRGDSFIGWYINGEEVATTKSYTIKDIASDIEIEAKFDLMYSQSELDGVGYSNSITNVISYSDASLSSSISGLYVLPGLNDNISITGTAYDVNNGLAYVVGNVTSTNKFGVSNSVLFVLDMNATVTSSGGTTTYQGKLIKEILLRAKGSTNAFTNCNGVTITSKYLWIASNGSINGCGYLNGIALSTINSVKDSAFVSFEEEICVPVNAQFVSFVPDYYTINKPVNKTGKIFVGEYADSTSSSTITAHQYNDTYVAWTVAYAIDESGTDGYLDNGFKATAINTQSEERYIAATPDYVFYTKNYITGVTRAGNKMVLVETDATGDSYIHIYDNPFEYTTIGNVVVNGTGKKESPYYRLDAANVGVKCGQNIQSITPYKESGNYYIIVAAKSGESCQVDTAYKVKIAQS